MYTIKGTNAKFLEAYAKDLFFTYFLSGAARTGKTETIASVFLEELQKSSPSDVFFIGTQSLTTFDFVICKALRRVKSDVSIQKTASGIVHIDGRDVIVYTYSDKERGKKLRGGEARLIWLDELHAAPRPVVDDIMTRTNRPDCRVILSGNPEGTRHWQYQQYIHNAEKRGKYYIKELSRTRRSCVFPSSMKEYSKSTGGHIDDGYIEMLERTLPKVEVQRLVYGEHVDSAGAVFDKSALTFYDSEGINSAIPTYCLIDPAFGQENCFSACVIFQQLGNDIYLIDAGLIRANSVNTSDEVISNFLRKYNPHTIWVENVFAQGELVKRLRREFTNINSFVPKGNKLERIWNAQIPIRDRVKFPKDWNKIPDPGTDWTASIEGRGFVGLMQLLNFSMDMKDNCIKGDDLSYLDFPDALASILQVRGAGDMSAKSIVMQSFGSNEFVGGGGREFA